MSVNENVVEQLQKLKNIPHDEYEKFEKMAFTTIDGSFLDTKSGLRREFMKIDTVFTFDSGEELSFTLSNHIRLLIEALSVAIDSGYDYDLDSLKRIVVLLELYLGIDVSYYKAMLELISEEKLESGLKSIEKDNFEIIYNFIKKKHYSK